MANYINRYATFADYTAEASARDNLGRTVSIVTADGKLHYDGKLNPLGLPPNTIRCKFKSSYTPAMGTSQTLVDSANNVWDIGFDSARELFDSNTNLLKVLGANTSSVTDMYRLFRGCTALESIPLFDTSSVESMNSFVSGCSSLKSIPLFDTSAVKNMSNMVRGCTALESIPLFDTSSVESMNNFAYGCSSLKSIPLFDTSSVESMEWMFGTCINLKSIPLFDTSAVKNMSNMANGCISLRSVPLFDTSSVESMNNMFKGCTQVAEGALAFYQQASAKVPQPSHSDTFFRCGAETITGAAELAQIPASWGGTCA